MTIPPTKLLLLDTTILVDLMRDTPTGRKIDRDFRLSARPERPLLCSIVEGEILGVARYRGWGEKMMADLQALFDQLVRVPSSHHAVIDAYATIYADAHRNGFPRGENDLWIAATAKATNAAVLTSDNDFLWLNGRHIDVHHVPVVLSR